MTCCVLVHSPSGPFVEARAVLDSACSASFVLAQTLCLPRSHRVSSISGIAGFTCKSSLQAVTQLDVSPLLKPDKKFKVSTIIMPRVTCHLPVSPVNTSGWYHLSDLPLANPSFSQPGRIDILLGVDIFVDILLPGWRVGPHGSPSALNTEFGWVLAEGTKASNCNVTQNVVSVSGDDWLWKFWEVEEHQPSDLDLTPEERLQNTSKSINLVMNMADSLSQCHFPERPTLLF